LQTHSFIGVNAIFRHPYLTKIGFAKQLITPNPKKILKEHKFPILYSYKGNLAIQLYEKIVYTITREMNCWLNVKR